MWCVLFRLLWWFRWVQLQSALCRPMLVRHDTLPSVKLVVLMLCQLIGYCSLPMNFELVSAHCLVLAISRQWTLQQQHRILWRVRVILYLKVQERKAGLLFKLFLLLSEIVIFHCIIEFLRANICCCRGWRCADSEIAKQLRDEADRVLRQQKNLHELYQEYCRKGQELKKEKLVCCSEMTSLFSH